MQMVGITGVSSSSAGPSGETQGQAFGRFFETVVFYVSKRGFRHEKSSSLKTASPYTDTGQQQDESGQQLRSWPSHNEGESAVSNVSAIQSDSTFP